MSPELLDPERFGLQDGRPTKRSDCYALGMVILEVLSGKPPFPNYNGFIIVRKVVEGGRPGRPQGREEVWFTDDLWEVLEQCWLPQPERRPTIDTVLQCVERGSRAWRLLPPDLDGYAQSDSDDESRFTLSHDPSIESSMFLRLVLNLTQPQAPSVADRIDSQDDDRSPSPGNQHRLAEAPVSTMSDMADMFGLYGNP